MLSKNRTNNKENGILWGYCFCLTLIFILICTKSSPLYPFNDWSDANSFFTMGKGMMQGKVLYRDLFEQKGPLLYFIHGLSYLIAKTSFLGVFIFEVFSFTTFLFYSHKLMALFLNMKYSLIALPLITATVLNMRCFSHGDSAEEFCLPFITVSLYYLIDYFINIYPEPANNRYLFINGIIAGCVLWIKFSLLGFWFGWMATMFFCMIIEKHYLRALKSCLTFLLGMLLATLPWVVYFGLNSAIRPWLQTYFLINIKSYAIDMGFWGKSLYLLEQVRLNIVNDPIFGVLGCLGLLVLVWSKRYLKNSLHRLCLFACFLFLAVGVYGGGRGYIYYSLIFSPLVILGFIVLFDFFSTKLGIVASYRTVVITVIISLIITLPITLLFNHNTYMLGVAKEDLVQYKFAAVIQETEAATLLNYGTLDIGLYTVTGITPNIKYFELQNIDYARFPLNMDEQNRYIKDKEIDYVVIMHSASEKLTDIPYLYDNYRLIRDDIQVYENLMFNYSLFKKKN